MLGFIIIINYTTQINGQKFGVLIFYIKPTLVKIHN